MADFIRLKVDVIVTNGPGAAAAKHASPIIPIVFALSPVPVGGGLVASLAHPGGNITDLSSQQTDTAGKRIELLRAVVPGLHRLAIMADAGYPQAMLEMADVQTAARAFRLDVIPLEIRQAQEIGPAFASLKAQADLRRSWRRLLPASQRQKAGLKIVSHDCRPYARWGSRLRSFERRLPLFAGICRLNCKN